MKASAVEAQIQELLMQNKLKLVDQYDNPCYTKELNEELKEIQAKTQAQLQRKGSESRMIQERKSSTALNFPMDIKNDFETGSQDSPKKSRLVIILFNVLENS